jgi:hypothetical protein
MRSTVMRMSELKPIDFTGVELNLKELIMKEARGCHGGWRGRKFTTEALIYLSAHNKIPRTGDDIFDLLLDIAHEFDLVFFGFDKKPPYTNTSLFYSLGLGEIEIRNYGGLSDSNETGILGYLDNFFYNTELFYQAMFLVAIELEKIGFLYSPTKDFQFDGSFFKAGYLYSIFVKGKRAGSIEELGPFSREVFESASLISDKQKRDSVHYDLGGIPHEIDHHRYNYAIGVDKYLPIEYSEAKRKIDEERNAKE